MGIKNRYIITSGFAGKKSRSYPWSKSDHHHDIEKSVAFHELWEEILFKYAKPLETLVLESPAEDTLKGKVRGQLVSFIINFGHQSGIKHGKLSGWTRAYLLGMLYAYLNDCDHIFVEQDVLCFGNWVEAIYENANKNGLDLSFGNKECAGKMYEQENSLAFIRREAIPKFIKLFLEIDVSDNEIHIERKVTQIRRIFGNKSGFHPFGYGFYFPPKDKPELPFYVHRFPYERLKYLADMGLIDKKYVV